MSMTPAKENKKKVKTALNDSDDEKWYIVKLHEDVSEAESTTVGSQTFSKSNPTMNSSTNDTSAIASIITTPV